MYQKILKAGNGDHKYLIYPDLLYKSFEVLRSEIPLDKVDLVCEKLLKSNLPETIQVLLPTKTQYIFWCIFR